MRILTSYLSLAFMLLLSFSCGDRAQKQETPDPLITQTLEQLRTLEVDVSRGHALRTMTEEDRELFKGLLNRTRATLLRIQTYPKDNQALSQLVDLQHDFQSRVVVEQDRSVIRDLQQSLGQVITRYSNLQGKAVPEMGYTLFSYNFDRGIYPFGTYTTGKAWETDWALDRSFVRVKDWGNRSWLVSPICDLTQVTNPRFTIRHLTNIDRSGNPKYADEPFDRRKIMKEAFQVMVSTKYQGGDPDRKEYDWTPLDISPMPSSIDFHTVTSPEVSLADYKGSHVTVAFLFDADVEKHGHPYISWQVENFKLLGSSGESLDCEAHPEKVYEHKFDSDQLGDYQSLSLTSDGPDWIPYAVPGGAYKFAKVGTNDKEADTWLLSPLLSLESAESEGAGRLALQVSHTANAPIWQKLHLKISKDYRGGDPRLAQWEELPLGGPPAEDLEPWTPLTTERLDLSGYIGEEVVVAFQFEASPEDFQVWEIESLAFYGEQTSIKSSPLELSFTRPAPSGDSSGGESSTPVTDGDEGGSPPDGERDPAEVEAETEHDGGSAENSGSAEEASPEPDDSGETGTETDDSEEAVDSEEAGTGEKDNSVHWWIPSPGGNKQSPKEVEAQP